MVAIRNYNDTKIELEISKKRLNQLIDRKEVLYSKYFKITSTSPSTKIKKINNKYQEVLNDENSAIKGSFKQEDPFLKYMIELEKINDETGKSLNEELTEQLNEVQKLEYYLKSMDYDMLKLKGIEYQLYCEIVINGTNISKAVEKIAEKIGKEPRTIWKYYYPKIKKSLNKLKKFSDSAVD